MQRLGNISCVTVSSPRVMVRGTIEIFHINWHCSMNSLKSANFTKALMYKLESI